MKLLNKSLLGAALAMALNLDANALSITPAYTPLLISTDFTNKQSEIDALIKLTFDPDPTLAYKRNVGDSDEGPFAASYSTSFDNTPSDPADATISYISGQPSITAEDIYLLVKDGNHTPAAYLFDISNWNGTDSLMLTGFWPDGGAISHVSIYTSGIARVPDGGATLMLLGIGLSGLVAARRLGHVATS